MSGNSEQPHRKKRNIVLQEPGGCGLTVGSSRMWRPGQGALASSHSQAGDHSLGLGPRAGGGGWLLWSVSIVN